MYKNNDEYIKINIINHTRVMIYFGDSLVTNFTSNYFSFLVHNASASPQHENTYKLEHLNPEQNYEVRIRAVTAAGPGANATAKFKTKHREDYGIASHLNYFSF